MSYFTLKRRMDSNSEVNSLIQLLEITKVEDFPEDFLSHYHTHILCQKGNLVFCFNDESLKCHQGEFVFWFANSRLTDLVLSKSFKAIVLLVDTQFLNDNVPDQSWGIDATLHSRRYPIMQLNGEEGIQRILSIFNSLYERFMNNHHHFYQEALKIQMRLFILDMWHTFAQEYQRRKRSLQAGNHYEQAMHLIQEHCMTERQVSFYANKLHITPKYLNYISKINSGITISEWIQRYTKERLEILLQNENINISEIADQMNFSSRSFFTRYVKKLLGTTPTAYRNRMST